MSDPKDPHGFETTSVLFGRAPSRDPDIRERQQTYLTMVGSSRDLEAEHNARVFGYPTEPAPASSATVPLDPAALDILGLLILTLPATVPAGYVGRIAWLWAAFNGFHPVVGGLAAVVAFGVAVGVLLALLIALPGLVWTAAGLALGANFGAAMVRGAHLSSGWEAAVVLGTAVVAMAWLLGLRRYLVAAVEFGDDRSTPGTIVASLLIAAPVVLIWIALFVFKSSDARTLLDPSLERPMTAAAAISATVALLSLVRLLFHLVSGRLNAAVIDTITAMLAGMATFLTGARHIARLFAPGTAPLAFVQSIPGDAPLHVALVTVATVIVAMLVRRFAEFVAMRR